jgi:hypothetical protein
MACDRLLEARVARQGAVLEALAAHGAETEGSSAGAVGKKAHRRAAGS